MGIVLKLRLAGSERLLRGQQHFWSVMRTLDAQGSGITTEAVNALSNVPDRSTISTFIRHLEAAGFIEKIGETEKSLNGRRSPVYRIIRNQGSAPKVGYADLAAVYRICQVRGLLPPPTLDIAGKMAKIEKFMKVSVEHGVLNEGNF